MTRRLVVLAVIALASSCGSGSGGTGGGSGGGTGGGSGGGAGGGSGGGSGGGGGGGTISPLTCTPAGFTTAPAAIAPTDFALGGELTVEAGDSDRSGIPGLGNENRVRLNVTTSVAYTELSVFANGCAVGKLTDVGEEYWWTTRTTDTAPAPVGGNFYVLEVVRQGMGVVRRSVFQLPPRLANLTAPAAHAAFTGQVALAWQPLGLATTAGFTNVSGFASGLTPQGSSGYSSMGVAQALDDASGQATANASSAFKDLELQWSARSGGMNFYFVFHRPVN